jgi:hypothetical protein
LELSDEEDAEVSEERGSVRLDVEAEVSDLPATDGSRLSAPETTWLLRALMLRARRSLLPSVFLGLIKATGADDEAGPDRPGSTTASAVESLASLAARWCERGDGFLGCPLLPPLPEDWAEAGGVVAGLESELRRR